MIHMKSFCAFNRNMRRAMSEVVLEKRGRLASITLTRPKSLNALTLPMVRDLHAALDQSNRDPGVGCILLSGEGKAFCAGGDVKNVMLAAAKEPPARETLADAFFREECVSAH
jgi:enoyl-CoA hydratase/carnithine racemase